MIARIAALRLRIAGRLAFKVGASDVVEQQIVVDLEQLSQTLLEMLLQRRLVRQQLIERAIEPVVIDLSSRNAEQIGQGAGLIAMLGEAQLAGGIAQASNHQSHGHCGPGYLLSTAWQKLFQTFEQTQPAEQFIAEPCAAEAARTLHPHAR